MCSDLCLSTLHGVECHDILPQTYVMETYRSSVIREKDKHDLAAKSWKYHVL